MKTRARRERSTPRRWFLAHPVPRARSQNLGAAPRDGLLERVALEERVVRFLRLPLREDHVAADRRDVLVQVRLDVARERAQDLEDAEKTLLELLFLPRLDVVVHPDGCHDRMS